MRTADGGVYDMANATSRQACADGNSVFWATAAAAAVRAASPGVLVSVGVFTPQAVCKPGFTGVLPVPGCADERYPQRPRALVCVRACTRARARALTDGRGRPIRMRLRVRIDDRS